MFKLQTGYFELPQMKNENYDSIANMFRNYFKGELMASCLF